MDEMRAVAEAASPLSARAMARIARARAQISAGLSPAEHVDVAALTAQLRALLDAA
jgi:hypothetical protein